MDKNSLKIYWNKSYQKISDAKLPCRYAVKIEREFPEQSNICELGGSGGVDALYFISKGHQVTNVDISDQALDRAKLQAIAAGQSEKLITLEYDYSNAKLPFASDSFDVVYSRLSLHYFNRETTGKLLQEIKRILKPGSKAYLTFKSPADQKEMDFLRKNARETEPGVFLDHGITKSRYTVDQFNEMLQQNNIENSAVTEITEDMSGLNDVPKSGNLDMMLTEVIITK